MFLLLTSERSRYDEDDSVIADEKDVTHLNCLVRSDTAAEQTHEGPQGSAHHEAHPGFEGAALNDSLHV